MCFTVSATKKCPFNGGKIFHLTLVLVYTLPGKEKITDDENIDI